MKKIAKRKNKIKVIKIISFIAGVIATLAAVYAVLMLIKKKKDAEKKKEEEIETEIKEIIEKKFAETEAENANGEAISEE